MHAAQQCATSTSRQKKKGWNRITQHLEFNSAGLGCVGAKCKSNYQIVGEIENEQSFQDWVVQTKKVKTFQVSD